MPPGISPNFKHKTSEDIMSKIYNFSAGPAVLNEGVLKAAADAAVEFKNTGMGLMEMSHRSKQVVEMFAESEALVRELLDVPENFKVLFLQGGASQQFLAAPLNFAKEGATVDYADTGSWSAKAIKEAKALANVNVVCSSKADTYSNIPKDLSQSEDATYLHITSNNTIYGTQWKEFPTPKNPNGYLVADMSSDIFSRPLDWSKFGLVYAGAQKNIGPSGVTLVVVREDLFETSERAIPTILNYKTHADAESMFHTPPVFSVYVANQTFNWLKSLGGVKAIQATNERKAGKLYAAIDNSKLFKNPVALEDRSPMNVTFIMENADLEPEFLAFAKGRGLETLKGHRSVGGFRASIYNAMPEAGVDSLIEAIQDFDSSKA
jgi:phosphoserine aminotransferase